MGVGASLTLVAMASATLLAVPLVASADMRSPAGSAWACAVQFLVARSLPSTPVVVAAADVDAAEELSEEGPADPTA